MDHMWIVCGSYVDPCSSRVVCQFKVMLEVLVCKEDCLIMFDIIIFIRLESVFPQGHFLASGQLQFMDPFSRVGPCEQEGVKTSKEERELRLSATG